MLHIGDNTIPFLAREELPPTKPEGIKQHNHLAWLRTVHASPAENKVRPSFYGLHPDGSAATLAEFCGITYPVRKGQTMERIQAGATTGLLTPAYQNRISINSMNQRRRRSAESEQWEQDFQTSDQATSLVGLFSEIS